MALTTKVLLNKVRQKSDGTYPLVIRVTYNRKVIYIPLGYTLIEKDFDARNQQIRPSSKIADNVTRLNKQITETIKDVYDTFSKIEENGSIHKLSLKEIKQIIIGNKGKTSLSVFDFIDTIMADLETAKKFGNAAVYRTLKKKLKAFSKKDDLTFSDINHAFLTKLEVTHYANGADAGGLSVYMRTLRATYNKAIKAGLISPEAYPFKDYKIKNKKPVRKALSDQEFERFKSIPLEKGSARYRARQLFLASYYMRGMNWIDMAYLKGGNIQGDFERLTYVRRKTGEPFNIKIHPRLKEILIQYLGKDYKNDDFVFPILKKTDDSNRHIEIIKNKRKRLNNCLKAIAASGDIDGFTVYTARHTYATMGKRKGVPTAVIQESMGHATEAMTQTYLDSFENKIVDDYDELIMND